MGKGGTTKFKKGQPRLPGSGRKKGMPNRATREIKEFFRALFESEEYQDGLKKRILAGKAMPIESLGFQYLYGRPKQVIEHGGKEGGAIGANVVFCIPHNSRDGRSS